MMTRATFIGVDAGFEHSLRTWLVKHDWLNDGKSWLSQLEANYTLFYDAPADRIEAIATALKGADFPPSFYLALLPPAKGERRVRTIANPAVASTRSSMGRRVRMVGEGRKVGVTPAELARRGGW